MQRRQFLPLAGLPLAAALPAATRRPNVILIITDDQGFGDLSLHGNPHLSTPNLDSIGRDGARFTQFHVCPVCSPTRACLNTGRYNYRTRVVDTYLGRSMMDPAETTAAEVFRSNGYRTGIFGKWHLGDHHPMRAIDKGFDEAVIHDGGGIAQPSDPPGGGSYYDPLLLHRGEVKKYPGYCTDIFFNEAMRFMEANRERPFFTYIATNAPHDPLQIDESYVREFDGKGLDQNTAKTYGMIRNLDDNAGRLMQHLRKLGLEQDTILIYMTDNGPQRARYNAGMRGIKGTVYEGGTRVPFFLRWPARVKPGTQVDRIAAHVDVLPTLINACGLKLPKPVRHDGLNLMPLLNATPPATWPDRAIFSQWHRGDAPEPFRNASVRTQRYKLIEGRELYDMDADPAESKDIAAQNPEIVSRLRRTYEEWFKDVSSTRGYDPPKIHLGTRHENPVRLTRQDWRGKQAGWAADSVGHWEVDVRAKGRYEIRLIAQKPNAEGEARLTAGGVSESRPLRPGSAEVVFESVELPAGPARLEATLSSGGKTLGVLYAEIRRIG
ncbi:MAG: arylsulfatase [Acidobacteria bacterium]|nr:arylsulfatase [Acidobacteriota bacterium]